MLLEVNQVEKLFRDLLLEAGVELLTQNKWGFWIADDPNAQTVWRVFKELAKLKVRVNDDENDALLFQWGAGKETETRLKHFYLDFTRQFLLPDANGEYDHMEQLNCTLKYQLNNELDLPLGNFWSYKFDNSFEAFFSAVEETEQFHLGMDRYQPFKLEMCQSQV